jgi:hypothetical protein
MNGDCGHASESGPPGNVVHNSIHDAADPLPFVRLVDQSPNKAPFVPKATEEKIAYHLIVQKDTKH